MTVLRIGHVNLRGPADLIEQLRSFYVDIIGLREGPRPTFRSGSSGYWLYAGEHDVIHLSVDPRRTTFADAPHAGFGHFAPALRPRRSRTSSHPSGCAGREIHHR